MVSIGFALIPASMISHIVSERSRNLKHMQLLSGMSLTAYWVSNLFFDILKALIPCSIVIGLLKAFDFFYDDVWRVFLMYPVGIVPFTYASSFLFTNDTVAQTVTIFLHFVVAGIGAIATFIMRCIDTTQLIGDRWHRYLKCVPSFCLTNPIMYMSSLDRLKGARKDLVLDDNMSLEMIGGDIVALAAHFGIGILLIIIIESGFFNIFFKYLPLILPKNRINKKVAQDLDDDVIREEQRIEVSGNDPVTVKSFRKIYTSFFRKPTVAVENISFGLDYGECFALLGVNGAGKTTTFRALTQSDSTSG